MATQCAEILQQRGHEVCGIISNNPEVRRWAETHGVLYREVTPDLSEILSERPFDYLFSVVNFLVLPQEVFKLPRRGAVNFHDSLLPKFAGFHATSWALLQGERQHGVTWHLMSSQIDGGMILKQRPIEVAEGETAFSLNTKCFQAGIEAFAELVDELAAGTNVPREQNLSERSYFSQLKRVPGAGVLSWNTSATALSALVRALDFGPYPNPFGRAKIAVGNEFFICPEIQVLDENPAGTPGVIARIAPDRLVVSALDRQVCIPRLLTLEGKSIALQEVVQRCGLREGDRLPEFSAAAMDRISQMSFGICKHEGFWLGCLREVRPVTLPYFETSVPANEPVRCSSLVSPIPPQVLEYIEQHQTGNEPSQFLLGAFAIYLARLAGETHFDLGLKSSKSAEKELFGLNSLFADEVPLRIEVDSALAFDEVLRHVQARVDEISTRKTYLRDIFARYPELRPASNADQTPPALPVCVELRDSLNEPVSSSAGTLSLLIPRDAKHCRWVFKVGELRNENARRMSAQFTTFLLAIVANPTCAIVDLPLISAEESEELLNKWNATTTALPDSQREHDSIELQARQAPDAIALVFEDQKLSYAELNTAANKLAHHLRKLGVGPDTLVGICVERSLNMVIGLLGILKAGGAYVPLDPSYPKDRLAFMVADARPPVLVTQSSLAATLPPHDAKLVCLDGDWDQIAREPGSNPESGVTPNNLAYVIYTSGSTGKPKGVMVTHANVINFFAGMDARIGSELPGTWLAVTSISFDISVLELFWTLARGFKVVLYAEDKLRHASDSRAVERPLDFSLFYFATDDCTDATDKYRLLIEGAKFADEHGFAAVWTPERHFHAFGGLYPNPSVTSAALATITKRIKLLAGSVVLPLHNPLRVAEEWSVVDNLSNGRVGISFAAGWQINDFVLAPENYLGRKEFMLREIESVRKLWRGEAITARDPNGKEVRIRILPRPVQTDLPIWITAAGNPETFKQAGELGANLLTHLLGQKIDELADKIALYRSAWNEKGHPGKSHITLMLHTFVGDDLDNVRETVRKPFTDYLRSSVDLIKNAPWAFPTFKQPLAGAAHGAPPASGPREFTAEELEAILGHAFERYFETSGLFGTPSSCLEMINQLKEADVDEIACLIDFGIDTQTVLASLEALNQVRKLANGSSSGKRDYTIPSLITRHGVTHLQCTPSMARMIMATPEGVSALKPIRKLLLGGEPAPVALVNELRQSIAGELYNMYGPTETTIWSTTYRITQTSTSVPIGRPIANTEIYLLDKNRQPVPIGVPGELCIGGLGVVRGYLNQPELTKEKFTPNPFSSDPEARLYRTGDLARYLPDGNIEFLGRIDHQVKIRGYRIELGEVEAVLTQHPEVRESVVVARDRGADDRRLVAYFVPRNGVSPTSKELRSFLQESLPEHMLPSAFVAMKAMPLTPNGKVDRRALPEPERAREESAETYVAPQNELEANLAKIWQEILNVEKVGIQENFFDLGGHSLLMMQVHARLREQLNLSVSIVELFRYPTIRTLAGFLSTDSDSQASLQQGHHRALTRKESMLRQQQLRHKLKPEKAK